MLRPILPTRPHLIALQKRLILQHLTPKQGKRIKPLAIKILQLRLKCKQRRANKEAMHTRTFTAQTF